MEGLGIVPYAPSQHSNIKLVPYISADTPERLAAVNGWVKSTCRMLGQLG